MSAGRPQAAASTPPDLGSDEDQDRSAQDPRRPGHGQPPAAVPLRPRPRRPPGRRRDGRAQGAARWTARSRRSRSSAAPGAGQSRSRPRQRPAAPLAAAPRAGEPGAPAPAGRPGPAAPAPAAPAPTAPTPAPAPLPVEPPRPAPVGRRSAWRRRTSPSPSASRLSPRTRATSRASASASTPCSRSIAVGGMAEVWKARMRGVEGFQKTVAIKKILPHLTDNAEFIGMFIDEAKLAAQLTHPNIVHIYDLGKIGRDYYIAMEYVDGKDLRSLLNAARRKGMPLPLGPRPADRARRARERPRLRPPQARLRGPRARPGAPRRLAAERPHHLRRRRQAVRLRHRQGGLEGEPDADGRAQGQAPVHVARAGLGRAGRRPLRPLLARRGALRDADRRAPVHRRQRDLGAGVGAPGPAPAPRARSTPAVPRRWTRSWPALSREPIPRTASRTPARCSQRLEAVLSRPQPGAQPDRPRRLHPPGARARGRGRAERRTAAEPPAGPLAPGRPWRARRGAPSRRRRGGTPCILCRRRSPRLPVPSR